MIRKKPKTMEEHWVQACITCTKYEQSPMKMERRLRAKGLTETETRKIIERLSSEDFINVSRFAEAFVHDKINLSEWGLIKIRRELIPHKIPEDITEKALEQVNSSDYRKIICRQVVALWEKHSQETDLRKRKQKVIIHMNRRGYEIPLIINEINKVIDEKI